MEMPHSVSWATLLLRPWSQALQVLPGGSGPQLPPVCVVISAVSLSPGPHDAGHLLQQQAVVPVDYGESLLLQLWADTGASTSTSCICAITVHRFIQRIPQPLRLEHPVGFPLPPSSSMSVTCAGSLVSELETIRMEPNLIRSE